MKTGKFATILKYFKRAILCALVLFVLADCWLIFIGWPLFIRRMLSRRLTPANGTCNIGWMRGDLLSGIELEDIAFTNETDLGHLRVVLPSVNIDFRKLALFSCHIVPDNIRISKASAALLQDNSIIADGAVKPKIFCYDGESHWTLSANDTLKGRLNFKFHGVTINGEVNFANCTGYDALVQYFSSYSAYFDLGESDSTDTLQRFVDEFDFFSLGNSDIRIHLDIDGNIRHKDSLHINGQFEATNAIINGILVPKLRNTLNYARQKLELHQLLLLSSQQVVHTNVLIDLNEQTISGDISGSAMPKTILTLNDLPTSLLRDEIVFDTPLEFNGKLPLSPLFSPKQWQPSVDFNFNQISIHRIPFYNGNGILKYRDGKLTLESLNINLDYLGRETMQINAEYDLDSKLVSGDVSGTCNLRRMLGKFYSLRHSVLSNEEQRERFKATLAPSPLNDWRKIRAEAQISRQKLVYDNIALHDLSTHLTLSDGKLVISDLTANIGENANYAIHANLQIPLEELCEHRAELKLPLQCNIDGKNDAATPTSLLNADGTIAINIPKGTIALERTTGQVIPTPFTDFLMRFINTNDADINEIIQWTQGDTPINFEMSMPHWDWNGTTGWNIAGQFSFKDCAFMTVPLQYGAAKVAVTSQTLSFSEITGALAEQSEPFSIGSIDIVYTPFEINIGNIAYQGAPELLEPFVYEPEAQEIYQQIWEHAGWDEKSFPKITVESLEYRDLPGNRWLFSLNGNFSATNAKYREMTLPKVSCDVDLLLPNDGLRLDSIKITTSEDKSLNASAILNFSNGISGEFKADFPEGNLDLLQIMRNSAPKLATHVNGLTLAEDSHFSCQGSFDTALSSLNIEGTVVTPRVDYRDFTLTDVTCDLIYSGDWLSWNLKDAKMDGGKLYSSGEYNFNSSNGKCIINAKDIPLSELAKLAPKSKNAETSATSAPAPVYQGVVNLNASANFFCNWANQPFLMDGYGHLELREADMWHIPLFSKLSKLLSAGTFHLFKSNELSKLGSISKLNADMEFRGSRIEVSQLATNGTIIALYGSGFYDLADNKVDFVVNSELLSAVRIISWPLQPLAWAFEARLTGTAPDISWKLQSSLRKYFSTKALD